MASPNHRLIASSAKCIQATFNRHHGVSPAPFNSLNVSFAVGDKKEYVASNRRIIKQTLGLSTLVSARQVHGDLILAVKEVPANDVEQDGFDALVTDRQGVGLMIQHADCQAILLHDPVQSAIAAIHCGWRGSVIGIIERTVQAMRAGYGCRPEDMTAAISPSLGPCCAEFINHRLELPASFLSFQERDNFFDFWQLSRWQLMAAGLPAANIQTAGICTSCSPDFFSYRRTVRHGSGITGRNCTIIALP